MPQFDGDLRPQEQAPDPSTPGFCAELGAATTVVLATELGLAISTTHTRVSGVLGAGRARYIGAVDLATVRDVILSWLVTVPAGVLLATVFFLGLRARF